MWTLPAPSIMTTISASSADQEAAASVGDKRWGWHAPPLAAPADALMMTLAPAALPRPVVRHAKSNSERGKEFRARRKKFEAELIANVHALRREIAELDRQRSLWSEQSLVVPHSSSGGSLTRLMQEYFRLFKFGLCDATPPRSLAPRSPPRHPSQYPATAEVQENFVLVTMDEDFESCEKRGPQASLEQWRRHTYAFDDNRCEVKGITAEGSEDEPVVTVHLKVTCRVYQNTFELIFPGALRYPDLVDKFMHCIVTFEIDHTCIFNRQGKVTKEIAKMDIVGAFLNAGFSLQDIADLMQFSTMSPEGVLPPPRAYEARYEPRLPSLPSLSEHLKTKRNMDDLLSPLHEIKHEQRQVDPYCRDEYSEYTSQGRPIFSA